MIMAIRISRRVKPSSPVGFFIALVIGSHTPFNLPQQERFAPGHPNPEDPTPHHREGAYRLKFQSSR
jgi:hypothetical protein